MAGISSSLSSWILLCLSLFLTSTIVYCACPSGWQGINNSCFKVYNEKKKWSEANETCSEKQPGAHLIYFTDARQVDFVNDLDGTLHEKEYFVGAMKGPVSWKWGNGDSVSIQSLLDSSHGKYAVLKKWDLKFYAVDGNHQNHFICELTGNSSVWSTLITEVTTSTRYLLSSSAASLSVASSSPSPSLSSSSLSSSISSALIFSSLTATTLSSSSAITTASLSSSSSSISISTASVSYVSSSQSLSSTSAQLPTAPLRITSLPLSFLPSPTFSSKGGTQRNKSLPLDNDLVTAYIQNLTKLNDIHRSSLQESVDMMQNVLVAMGASITTFTNQTPLLASQKLEEFALRYMESNSNEKEILIKRSNVVLHAEMVLRGSSDYLFETDDDAQQETYILLPKENFVDNETSVVSIYYTNLGDIMNKQENNSRNNRYEVRSKILSTSIHPKKNKLVKNATIGFKIPASGTSLERKCVFWDFSKEKVNVPGWSTEGCTLVKSTDQYVECLCNHLTHFAVLMQVKNDQLSSDNQDILSIITYLGLAFSILGCIMTFITYSLLTDVKSEQSQIRMNLVFVLAAAHILFLLGSPARNHIVLCISVAALMQLFYTSALCWMFAEGIQLYMQVIKVFNTNLKMRQVYGFAWGFPLFLIVISLSIAANSNGGLASFVNKEFCWLSTENHVIWTFVAPVLLLIMGNMIILGLVIREMRKITKPMATGQRANVLRSSFKAFIVLAPLLGITWIMGLLCIVGAGVVGLYIFTILNSTQGFFIFIFHCLRNSEIRDKLKRKIQAFDDSHLKQESSVNHPRSKSPNQIKTKPVTKPNTPETAVGNILNVQQDNMALSELDSSDEIDGEAHNNLKLKSSI